MAIDDIFREPPTPSYDYDVRKLVSAYERALTDIQAQLNTLLLSDFERASILAVQADIAATLKELNGFTAEWTDEALTKAVTQGSAAALYSLGLAETMQEATNIVKFNRMNKELVKAAIADTQADLLAVTQNVERRTRAAVRTATSEMMRANVAQGINGTATLRRDLTERIRKQLGDAADTSIIDSIGRRWKLTSYTDMLVRTKMLEAHKESTVNEAVGRDVQYGVISKHGATDACRNYENKIVKLTPDAPGDYPYINDLPRREIFHPNCKHVVSPVRRLDRLPKDLRELNGIEDTKKDNNVLNENSNSMRKLTDEKEIVKSGGKVLKGNKAIAKLYGVDDSEDFEYMLAEKAKDALKGKFRGVAEVHFNLLDEWVTDNTDDVGKAIENYFSKKFDLTYKLNTAKKVTKREEAVLDHMHGESVSKLKEQGVTHIKVYRGVGWNDSDTWMPKDKENMSLNGRGLSSWTFDKSVAETYAEEAGSFSGVQYDNRSILEANVPIDKVAFLSGPGSNEEATIIGDIDNVNIITLKRKRR